MDPARLASTSQPEIFTSSYDALRSSFPKYNVDDSNIVFAEHHSPHTLKPSIIGNRWGGR